jgi:predicted DNA-binding transcriptional regulator AlpA
VNVHKQKLLTEQQAATYISMSRSFLRQSRMDGLRTNRTPGPAWIQIGSRSIRYRVEDLDEWIASFPKYKPAEIKDEELKRPA